MNLNDILITVISARSFKKTIEIVKVLLERLETR